MQKRVLPGITGSLMVSFTLSVALAACSGTTTPSGSPSAATTASPQPTETTAPTAAPLVPIDVGIGYIPAPGGDLHFQIATAQGFFEDRGLNVEPIRFDSGATLGTALLGGSIDLGSIGAALPLIASRGGSIAILINDIELNTTQIWAAADIESVADLEGRTVAFTTGTSTHLVIKQALESAGLDLEDVEAVTFAPPDAAAAFIAGQVDAIVTFPPFILQIPEARADAHMIASSGDYYPDMAFLGGYIANIEFAESEPEALHRMALAWLDANDFLISDREAAIDAVHPAEAYKDLDRQVLAELIDVLEWLPNDEWAEMFEDGRIVEALADVENRFIEVGAFETFVDPGTWLDDSIYLDALEEWNAEQ